MKPNTKPFTVDAYPDLTAAIRGVVSESHTRAELEKKSTTELRALRKAHSGKTDPRSAETRAHIHGILRSRGAGHALDEGVLHEGGMKAALHDFMEGLPAKAVAALRPVMGDPSIRGGTLRAKVGAVLKRHGVPGMVLGGSSAQIVIDNWDTFHGDLSEATEGDLHGGGATSVKRKTPPATAKKFRRVPAPVVYTPTTPRGASPMKVSEACGECTTDAIKSLKAANTADLKDKPGAAGKAAHKRLHKTIGKVLKSTK
jgi:hypothetical protein